MRRKTIDSLGRTRITNITQKIRTLDGGKMAAGGLGRATNYGGHGTFKESLPTISHCKPFVIVVVCNNTAAKHFPSIKNIPGNLCCSCTDLERTA